MGGVPGAVRSMEQRSMEQMTIPDSQIKSPTPPTNTSGSSGSGQRVAKRASAYTKGFVEYVGN